MAGKFDDIPALTHLFDELVALHQWVCEASDQLLSDSAVGVFDDISPSRRNLAHYLTLRRRELRPLQGQLANFALSSLGRSEAHVMDTLETLIQLIARTLGRSAPPLGQASVSFRDGDRLLKEHIEALFGLNGTRLAHIMVTLPSEAATNHGLVDDMVSAGAGCFRINCAHDNADAWEKMVVGVRAASQRHGRFCPILMDLSGPKLRTGAVVGAETIGIELSGEPKPDDSENIAEQLLITNQPQRLSNNAGKAMLVSTSSFAQLALGDMLRFRDDREKKRRLKLVERVDGHAFLATCKRRAVIGLSTEFVLERQGSTHDIDELQFHAQGFSARSEPLRLRKGDKFWLVRDIEVKDFREKSVSEWPQIGIQVPEVLDKLQSGTRVWFDDGKLGGYVAMLGERGVLIEVDHAPPKGAKLASDKGINVPNVDLGISALDRKDLQDLDFVVSHADMVGLSFTERQADVDRLISELGRRDSSIPIILKVETGRGLAALPSILLNTLDRHFIAVMIARGDLAVEVGGERMAELQEELLWLCEAGHVPVIWATQVLETLIKQGKLSRPEMTDAAASGRADCVMLNKGPYILKGVQTLNDILSRMQEHQRKKTARLRPLRWSEMT